MPNRQNAIHQIPDGPFSFEGFSDDLDEMEWQALKIADWGANVYVKIPVTNSVGVPCYDLIHRLAQRKVQVNVTAIMTMEQMRDVSAALEGHAGSYVSVFAGRVADTGRDPVPMMAAAVSLCSTYATQELIWALLRELLAIFQADAVGCQVITVTPDMLRKMALVGKDLTEFSLDTVKMFRTDAVAAGFTL